MYNVIGIPSSGSIEELKTSLNSIQGGHIEGSPFLYNGRMHIIVKDKHSSLHSKISKGSKGGKSRTKHSYKNTKNTRKRK